MLSNLGVAGYWNDMNEPANFALPSKTLPEDCPHNSDVGPLLHKTAHNLYGMQMARASCEGALTHKPAERPFVITRAGYAGVQRYAMVWTGDNSSVWEHLTDAIQMFLNLSISGLPFCGGDIGGFVDNTTPELFVRWLQMATFTPFYRNHTDINTIDQEPWSFGPQIEAISREFIQLRYQLLPYLYGLFVKAHRYGTPIMRPLFWHYQDDPVAVAASDQFLLGQNLLVAPILRQGGTARNVYLPKGEWFNFWNRDRHLGGEQILAHATLDSIPVFVRAGAIIPMAQVRQFVGEKKIETINLHIWPGAGGLLNWYEDDGSSLAYTSGDFHERRISASLSNPEGKIEFSAPTGNRISEIKTWRIILRASNRRIRAKLNKRILESRYDESSGICSIEFPNFNEPFEVLLH